MKTEKEILVQAPGVLTTVQDAGRFGYLASGITQSGAMDQAAYRFANALVGNRRGEAVLECTVMGPTLLFTGDAVAALAGADMNPTLDGRPVEMGKAFVIRGGQVLALGMAERGLRTYLAVAGGIDVPSVLGSRSTNIRCGMGGLAGRALQAKDVLPVGSAEGKAPGLVRPYHPAFPGEAVIRCIPGPQEDAFTEEGIAAFYGSAYTVTPESDRMGMRLAGPVIAAKNGSDIVSDGIVFGSIQVPKSGLPIILMADHQTTGGYAKIATAVSLDLPILAQAVPGTKIRFQRVCVEEIQGGKAASEEKKVPKKRSDSAPCRSLRGWKRCCTWRERR